MSWGLTRASREWGRWFDYGIMSRHRAHSLPAGFDESADELAPTVLEGDNEDGGPC
jgi:hypothetical protein